MANDTEFSAPSVKHAIFHRRKFTEVFKSAISKPLTIVTAPGGYGKTTACISALSNIGSLNYSWVTLTDRQNDGHHFVNCLLHALNNNTSLELDLGATNLAASEANNAFQRLETLLDSLAAALLDSTSPFVIVLDDYHKIDNEDVHRILSYWIDESPINIRTVLLSRTRPFLYKKYKDLSGVCTYLDQEYCKFDLEETDQFFSESMQLQLEPDYLKQIYAHSQGWPLGIQLIAIKLRLSKNSAMPLVDLKDISDITSEYFRANVYEILAPETKRLIASIGGLSEFSAELLDYIFEDDSGTALIATLEDNNLFLFNSGEGHEWYRFHDLFQEFLQEQTTAIDSDVLKKAARWYYGRGDFYTAVNYLLKGNLFQEAADWIEAAGDAVFRRGEIQTLANWIKALPSNIKNKRPKILVLECWCIPDVEKPLICPLILDQIAKLLFLDREKINLDPKVDNKDRPKDYQQLFVDYLLVRAYVSPVRVDAPQTLKFGLLALKEIEENSLEGFSRCNLTLGEYYYQAGDHQRAIVHLESAIQYSKYENHPYVMIISLGFLMLIYQTAGKLNAAISAAEEITAWLEGNGFSNLPMTNVPRSILTDVYLEKNELARSERMLKLGLEYCALGVPALQVVFVYIAQYRHLISIKEYDQARVVIERIEMQMPRVDVENSSPTWTFGTPSIGGLSALIDVSTGRIAQAQIWLDSVKNKLMFNTDYVFEKERLVFVKVLLVCGHRDDALEVCRSIKTEAIKNDRLLHVVQCLLLESVIAFSGANMDLAKELFKEALVMGIGCGFRRVFLEAELILNPLIEDAQNNPETRIYVEKLWSSKLIESQEPKPSKEQTQLSLLTRRESSVIVLLSDGASNKEIAQTLNIAPDTAKQFVKSILKKLEVRNRTEAALVYRAAVMNDAVIDSASVIPKTIPTTDSNATTSPLSNTDANPFNQEKQAIH
ncbi:MAG: hypothetical protein COB04_07680 [Gammaproteobacteria bacterium]|nr:MAG: hypothetical protein COB04_07680 [Gammaproteobacteria bacterium]